MTGISATIHVDTTTLIIGSTSTVEIAFNEAATGFDASDLILPGGSIGNLTSADGGVNWTATYTPQAGIQSANNVISLNLSNVMDSGGVAGANLQVDSNNFLVDGVAPSIDAITVQNASLLAGQTSQVTFHFSELVNGFNLSQVIVGDGTLSNLTTSNNITWTATLTPRDGVNDQGLTITAHPIVTDFAGNSGGGSASSNAYNQDTVRPQGQISLVHNIVLDPTHAGDVLVNFNEPVTGLTAGALIGNGAFSNIQAIDASDYSATFTPNAGIQSASQTFSVDMTQVTGVADGNAGAGTITSAPFSVDTLGPTSTVTIGSGAPVGSGGAAVTIAFSEPVSGFADNLVSAQNGSLSTFTTTDNQTFHATFTPTAATTVSGDHISVDNTGVTDAHGNAGTGTGTAAYDVDTVIPVLQSANVSDVTPHAGAADRVDISFSEAVTGFTLGDISAQNATVSNLVDDGGGAFHATLTPNEGVVANSNVVIVNSAGVSDLAGNPASGGAIISNSYNLDTIRPTAALHMTDTLIGGSETSAFSINFSEAVSGFDNSDLNVTGGTLSTVATVDNIHFTATFTPSANTFQTGDVISLNTAGVTSVATGNAGLGSVNSNSFNVETQPPAVSSIQTPAVVPMGQGSFNVIFSEPVTVFPQSAIGGTAQGSFLTPGTSDFTTWNVRFNPNANTNQTGATFTIDLSQVVDQAGNHGTGTATSNPFNIDDIRPTAVSLNVGAGVFHAGDTAPVTLTFSEAVQSVTPQMFSFPFGGGSVSTFSTADGGTTWTGTFTPPAGALQANEAIEFNVNDVVDLAGNPGNTGGIISNQYNVLTLVPTATISLSDNHVGTGGQLTVTIDVNDVHVVPTFSLSAQDADITGLHQTGSTSYQATLTPHAGAVDPNDVVSLTGLDNTFNVNPASFTSSAFALSTVNPGGTVNLTATPLHAGQTAAVDFHFTEGVQSVPLAAISAHHGAVSNLMSTNGGVDWTAVFTPTANDPSDQGSVSLDLNQVQDFGGNLGTGGVVTSGTVSFDTLAPTATIVLDHATLTAGQTAGVTVTFSEPVTGFTNADLAVADGTLSAVSSADGGHTWTSTFTPTASVFHDGDHITLDNTGVLDLAGNPGVGTTTSGPYNVETGPPPPPPPAAPSPPPPPVDGPETLTATAGNSTISGGVASDMVIGSSGSDSMSGQGGSDTLSGGDGNDFLQGNVGTDSVNGGTGDDKVYGGQGDDQVQGGPGADFVSGDKGDDTVRGGQGDDSVSGGEGNDFLSGDKGDDTMTGGPGADTFHAFAGAGLDVVTDFNLAEGDRIELDPGTTFTSAQVGADTVITLSGAGGGGQLILQDVQLSSLHGDWIFVG